jgi:hypothetical protein
MNMTKRVERQGEVSSVSEPVLSFIASVMAVFPFRLGNVRETAWYVNQILAKMKGGIYAGKILLRVAGLLTA